MNIALIGFGGMGRYHLRMMKLSKLFTVCGIFDTDAKKLELAKREGYHTYSSAQDLFCDTQVESVLIATPNDSHAEYVIEACQNKKNVICEKPVTLDSKTLQKMIDSANKNNVIFTVNQNRRWDNDYLTAKNVCDKNLIGKPYKIMSHVMGSHGIPGDWRKEVDSGGGMIYDWGVHLIDQALQFIPYAVTSIYCKTQYNYGFKVDDGCFIVLTFANGVEYHINIDTNTFIQLPRWLVYGENGSAVIKNWAIQGKIICVKEFLDLKNKGIKAGNGFTKTMADRSRSTIVRHRLPKVKAEKYALYKNFCLACENKADITVTHKQLLRVMKIMEGCFESAKDNKVILTDI